MRIPLRRPPTDAQALARVHATLPRLSQARAQLESDGHQVAGVVLPDSMRPPGWEYPAAVMGLPVTWGGKDAGLVVRV